MKVFKTVGMICVITLSALLYVHQQIELVKLSYVINLKEKKVKEMLDHKGRLSYNIENLESPERLEKILLARKIDIAFPKRSHVVAVKSNDRYFMSHEQRLAAAAEQKGSFFGIFDFFIPRAEAQTKEQ